MAMAEELSLEPDEFTVDVEWPAAPEAGGNEVLDASIARFEIKAGSTSLTSFQADAGTQGTHLTIPTYYLVEWLAQNWWAFLYEPRKLDSGEAEAEFRSRHWLGVARNGFALPDAMFVPSGPIVEIVARQSYLRFAQLGFMEAGTSVVRTEDVRAQLSRFIEVILGRMTEKGVVNSDAHEAWKRVVETSAEEESYCRLLGAMGLSPYIEHPEIDQALDGISDDLAPHVLEDLCEATRLASFKRAAEFTGRISEALAKSSAIVAEPFFTIEAPKDNMRQAYDWGYEAASQVRKSFGISDDDPSGRVEFFQKLGIDPKLTTDMGTDVSTIFPIQGAVTRDQKQMKLALSAGTDKEFSAARASFLAWMSGVSDSRLVTTARTRQQRASRAFGAELLAPAAYLKKRLGKEKDVSPFTLDKVSSDIGVASTIVRLQAQNNGYRILEAA
jgi:hypothetical protein